MSTAGVHLVDLGKSFPAGQIMQVFFRIPFEGNFGVCFGDSQTNSSSALLCEPK